LAVEFGTKRDSSQGTGAIHARALRLLELKAKLLLRYSANSLKSLPISVQQDFAVAARRAGLTLLASDCGGDTDSTIQSCANTGASEAEAI
jgi:hypothetical protein